MSSADTKLLQIDYKFLTFESEFVGTLYPRKFKSEKTSRVNAFGGEFVWICAIFRFSNSLQSISNSKHGGNFT